MSIIRGTVRKTMNRKLACKSDGGRMQRVHCQRALVSPLPNARNKRKPLVYIRNPRKDGSLTPITWNWSPKAFSAAWAKIDPAKNINNPAVLPTTTPSTPKTSGGEGREYSVIHSGC